jgi:hypothetical protein
MVLLLGPPPPGWGEDDEGVVIELPVAAAFKSDRFEAAGAAFHEKCKAALGLLADG